MTSDEIEAAGRAECIKRGIDPDREVDLNRSTSRFLVEQGLEPEWEDGHATMDVYMWGPAWQAFAPWDQLESKSPENG
jgi:hypothetical protein